jgi:hypothetical protein
MLLYFIMPKDSQYNGKSSVWHLLGPKFDSSGSKFSESGLKKSPNRISPALGLCLMFTTLLLGRCRVASCVSVSTLAY